jgi:hypothetical protein
MRMSMFLVLAAVTGWWTHGPDGQELSPCRYFHDALEGIPHDSLTISSGDGVWLWHEERYVGCQVRFVTRDSISEGYKVPDFDAVESSRTHSLGWRFMHGVAADGPGSGIFGIERGSVQCLVYHEQPAYIDENGEFWQSDTLEITIQCREGGEGQ